MDQQPPSHPFAVKRATFLERYCSTFGCRGEDYEQEVLRRCLYRHAVPFAAWVSRAMPGFFKEDFEFVRDLASCHDVAEVRSEINRFYGRNQRDTNKLRVKLRVRVSGERVRKLAALLFRDLE
jgi:hypothetical protein